MGFHFLATFFKACDWRIIAVLALLNCAIILKTAKSCVTKFRWEGRFRLFIYVGVAGLFLYACFQPCGHTSGSISMWLEGSHFVLLENYKFLYMNLLAAASKGGGGGGDNWVRVESVTPPAVKILPYDVALADWGFVWEWAALDILPLPLVDGPSVVFFPFPGSSLVDSDSPGSTITTHVLGFTLLHHLHTHVCRL